MHIKVFSPSGWDFGESIVEMVKVSSRGLIGADRQYLIKRAGHSFADQIDRSDIQPDEVPIHLIAMGATEKYNINRNGDGWTGETLKKSHHTFVKRAKHFRHHKNDNPALSYGVVKASAYHEPMGRVELLVALNRTKSAAERNNGLVADEELQLLAKHGEYPVSMSCVVSHDRCLSCGNEARTRAEYCRGEDEGGHCKHGGCFNKIGRVCEDGLVLGVDNPNPTFIDISRVARGADRTAFAGIADYLHKAASADVMGGAELAERLNLSVPLDLLIKYAMQGQPEIEPQYKLACALALLQKQAIHLAACGPLPGASISVNQMGVLGTSKFAEALTALANEGIVLPLSDFVKLHYPQQHAELAKAAQVAYHGVFDRLIKDPDVTKKLASNPYQHARSTSPTFSAWARKHAADYALLPEAMYERSMLSSLRGIDKVYLTLNKTASATQEGMQLAQQYAIYQIAALCKIASVTSNFDLTLQASLLQN